MKVAIVCGAGIVSGKEIVSLELGEGLRAAGQDVVFVMSEWGSPDFAERLRAMGVSFYRMRTGFISATISLECLRMTAHQMLYWPKLMFDWARFLRREKPTAVIHTNWHHLLLVWPWLRVERDVFWLHETFAPSKRYASFLTALSRRVGFFAVVSQAVAEGLRMNGVPETKIRVIHNGIRDPSRGISPDAREVSEVAVGIVGAIGAWKGHEDLIEAFAIVAATCSGARLHVFGADDKEYAARLKRRVDELGLARRVAWHGFVRDRSRIYPKIDICAVPSRSDDPLPTTAIEAAFFGLPVVATRKGGLPEIVVDGETGFIVDAENPVQLAARLEDLVRDAELRARMGAAARRRAVAMFGRDRFVGDFLRLLDATPLVSDSPLGPFEREIAG